MGGGQSVSGLRGPVDRVREGWRAFVTQDGRQIPSLQQLHDEIEGAVGILAEIVNGDHAGVVQAAGRACLAEKQVGPLVTSGWVEHLDRDVTPDHGIECRPHLAHPAAAQQLFQLVPARDYPFGQNRPSSHLARELTTYKGCGAGGRNPTHWPGPLQGPSANGSCSMLQLLCGQGGSVTCCAAVGMRRTSASV